MTPLRRRFVAEYLRAGNATRAAIRAGYARGSARNSAARVLCSEEVRAAIEAAAARRDGAMLADADRAVLELMRVAFSDIRNYVVQREDGTLALRPRDALAPDESAAVASVAAGGRHGQRLRLHRKKQALHALARHVGLFDQRASVDPMALHQEAAAIRAMLFKAAGIDDAAEPKALPPPGDEAS